MKVLAIKAGLAYFALVSGAGFVLGALRVTVLVPRLGERIAELSEMPFMFVASRDPVSGSVYLVMLVIFSTMPVFIRQPSGPGTVRREPPSTVHSTGADSVVQHPDNRESVSSDPPSMGDDVQADQLRCPLCGGTMATVHPRYAATDRWFEKNRPVMQAADRCIEAYACLLFAAAHALRQAAEGGVRHRRMPVKLIMLILPALLVSACVVGPASGKGEKAGGDTVLLCHKGKKTLELPQEAVQAHLDHGDHLGPC